MAPAAVPVIPHASFLAMAGVINFILSLFRSSQPVGPRSDYQLAQSCIFLTCMLEDPMFSKAIEVPEANDRSTFPQAIIYQEAPFRIWGRLDSLAYDLDLPKNWHMHPVISAVHLEQAEEDGFENDRSRRSGAQSSSAEEGNSRVDGRTESLREDRSVLTRGTSNLGVKRADFESSPRCRIVASFGAHRLSPDSTILGPRLEVRI